MPFSYYKKLPARVRRIYDRSNEIGSVRLPAPERLRPLVDALAQALQTSDRAATEAAAQKLCAAMLKALKLPGVKIRVLAKRPSRSWGELHGLYEPQRDRRPLITVWMRTAQRRQVVAFKTFLRTVLHEIGHHLDYELLELEDSLHTEGFYKRESSLFRQLVPDPSRYEAGRTQPGSQRNAKIEEVPRAAKESGSRRQRSPKRETELSEAQALQPELPFADG